MHYQWGGFLSSRISLFPADSKKHRWGIVDVQSQWWSQVSGVVCKKKVYHIVYKCILKISCLTVTILWPTCQNMQVLLWPGLGMV